MTMFLGIDTSAYTTSLAIADGQGGVLADERVVLPVKAGDRGLRQSEALFYHVKNLPELLARVLQYGPINAIGVSSCPRRVENSYMPVFLAGASLARSLSIFNQLPLFEVSHQEGHVMAALIGNEELFIESGFLAVHFSGGTSEILEVRWNSSSVFEIETGLSGSDLHAGQLVDRVGVALGLPFPAGRHLEQLARTCVDGGNTRIPAAVKPGGFSFSGAETRALNMLKQGEAPGHVARELFRMLARTLEKGLLLEADRTGIREVLLAGGVMANQIIREYLAEKLEHPARGFKLHFASPHLSTDNAVGVARLAGALYKRNT